MIAPGVDVLVVGGGIAGWSAAWCARRRGRRVTVVDEGVHRASDLPVALVNPLRGHTGRLVADGVQGMHATFALIEALRAAGHAIDSGRGLFRPLIGIAPEARTAAYWTERIAGRLAFDWHDVAPPSLGLAEPVPALFLREAGWVAPPGLLAALRAESGASLVVDRVTKLDRTGTATLASGPTIAAGSVLWCGGAWGSALLDHGSAQTDGALYKPGSLLVVDGVLTREPLSFGLYAVPRGAGTVIGPTREGSRSSFPGEPIGGDVVRQLGERIGRVFGSASAPHVAWRGVRLARLSAHAGATLSGIPTLTALGSRGFLMAPLLAAEWARSL